jgi:hypothetical protein
MQLTFSKHVLQRKNGKTMLIKNYFAQLFLLLTTFVSPNSYADQDLISLFPLDKYDQNVSTWIRPNAKDYDRSLFSDEMQKYHYDNFYNHYFGTTSPWDAGYINKILHAKPPEDLKNLEQTILSNFTNESTTTDLGYGSNFRPHTKSWTGEMAENISLKQFDNLNYQADHRAIAIENLSARALPTNDPYFYSHQYAGQGYPFDMLQMSAIWIGTPLYILVETKDRAWSLVVTPDFIGWVKSSGIARANENFISYWKTAAQTHLAAITHTKTSLVAEGVKGYLASAYIGTVLPATKTSLGIQLMVPSADHNRFATINYAEVSTDQAAFMPLAITKHHFAMLMSEMKGRPYGWGNIYFYNDCSAELKNLFAPFGIWLPRHSSNQVSVGKMVDLSTAPADKRLAYLMENGRPYLTLLYIGGHIILYIGNFSNPYGQTPMAMTYQNVWGLSPNPPIRRAVIGQSVFIPLLLQYPEDTSLMSLAGRRYFQVAYLNEVPERAFKSSTLINLRALMSLESLRN